MNFFGDSTNVGDLSVRGRKVVINCDRYPDSGCTVRVLSKPETDISYIRRELSQSFHDIMKNLGFRKACGSSQYLVIVINLESHIYSLS